jgi:hypothetical protein
MPDWCLTAVILTDVRVMFASWYLLDIHQALDGRHSNNISDEWFLRSIRVLRTKCHKGTGATRIQNFRKRLKWGNFNFVERRVTVWSQNQKRSLTIWKYWILWTASQTNDYNDFKSLKMGYSEPKMSQNGLQTLKEKCNAPARDIQVWEQISAEANSPRER